MKDINIIIPVYHSRKTLGRALMSLADQLYKEFKVTIVQDGDGEDYTDIVEQYRGYGLEINVMPLEENVGPGLARQAGMDADNESKYFILLDSDDLILPYGVESLYRGMENNKLDILTSSFIRHGQKENAMQDVQTSAITWCAGKIYLAKYLKENNIRFHPTLRLNEDSYFNVVAWNSTPKRGQLNEATFLMMDNGDSLTRQNGLKGFFLKGWNQYIISQVEGMKEIYRQTLHLEPRIAGRTLVYLYNECMIARHYGLDTSEAKYNLHKLNVQWFKKIMDMQDFWKEIEGCLRGCQVYDKELVFFDYSFGEWLKWILEE